MSVKIFISCVSKEFLAYRDQLRRDLTRHNVEVKVQEDFKDLGALTLEMQIPMKPAMHSKLKPATRSDLKPAIVPI
jgi:hypothetical protein